MRGVARAAATAALTIGLAASASAATPESRTSAASAGKAAVAASAPAAPIEFDGTLESGKTYVAEVVWDNNALHIWRPVKEVKVPRGHAWTIDWLNLAKFTALKTPAARARAQRFQFVVQGVDVSSGSPAIPWTTIYRCEVLAADAIAGTPAAATKRK